MKTSNNQINELLIKFNYRTFGFYIAILEFDYALFKATTAAKEFNEQTRRLNIDKLSRNG